MLKSGPVTRVCHVCGRQYGRSSFDIHLKQCKKLWIAQEEQKPVHERRPLPSTPPSVATLSLSGTEQLSRAEIDALNAVAQESFNTHGLETCEYCHRTFAEGRLAIHNKSCRGDSVAKKVGEGSAPRTVPKPAVEYGRVKMPATPKDRKLDQEQTKHLAGTYASNRKTYPVEATPSETRDTEIPDHTKEVLTKVARRMNTLEKTISSSLKELQELQTIVNKELKERY